MRTIVDTNVFFSAIFHPTPQFSMLMEYLFTECDTLVPEYVAKELRSKALLKHPEQATLAADFLDSLGALTPDATRDYPDSVLIRDPKDLPILNAAFQHDVDIIISGDKHFRELDIARPRILKPAQFIAEFIPEIT